MASEQAIVFFAVFALLLFRFAEDECRQQEEDVRHAVDPAPPGS